MELKEIREAAFSASKLNGYERIEYIQNSYQNQKQHWAEILQLADTLNKNPEICKYYGEGKIFS